MQIPALFFPHYSHYYSKHWPVQNSNLIDSTVRASSAYPSSSEVACPCFSWRWTCQSQACRSHHPWTSWSFSTASYRWSEDRPQKRDRLGLLFPWWKQCRLTRCHCNTSKVCSTPRRALILLYSASRAATTQSPSWTRAASACSWYWSYSLSSNPTGHAPNLQRCRLAQQTALWSCHNIHYSFSPGPFKSYFILEYNKINYPNNSSLF